MTRSSTRRAASMAPLIASSASSNINSESVPSSQPNSDLPFNSNPNATDPSQLLPAFRNVLVTTLGPLNTRLDALETQLQSQNHTNLNNLDDSGPTQQLQQELEGGESNSVFLANQLGGGSTMVSIGEGKTISQWFSGVRPEHIRQILRNEFLPTDIGKLLLGLGGKNPSRKDGTLVPRLNSEGGIEFTNRDITEEDYNNMWSFLQAWEMYRGIFLWGAPSPVRGQLASALSAYTNSIFKLRKSYPWPAVRNYHFAFHSLRLEDSSSTYDPEAWRRINPDLVSEHCLTAPLSSTFNTAASSSRSRQQSNRYHPYNSSDTNNYSNRFGSPPLQNGSLESRIRFPPGHPAPVSGSNANMLAASSTAISSVSGFSQRRFPGLCDHWNSRQDGCVRTNCRFTHACNACGRSGHPAFECTAPQGRR